MRYGLDSYHSLTCDSTTIILNKKPPQQGALDGRYEDKPVSLLGLEMRQVLLQALG